MVIQISTRLMKTATGYKKNVFLSNYREKFFAKFKSLIKISVLMNPWFYVKVDSNSNNI